MKRRAKDPPVALGATLSVASPVADLLAATNLSQYELARQAGVGRTTVQSALGVDVRLGTLDRFARAAGGSLVLTFIPGPIARTK